MLCWQETTSVLCLNAHHSWNWQMILTYFFADKIATTRDNIINTQFNGIKPTPVEPVNESITLEMNSFQSVLERDVEKRICK